MNHQICTDDSRMDGFTSAGAGIHRDIFARNTRVGRRNSFRRRSSSYSHSSKSLVISSGLYESAAIISYSKAGIQAVEFISFHRPLEIQHRQSENSLSSVQFCNGFLVISKHMEMKKPTSWPGKGPKLNRPVSPHSTQIVTRYKHIHQLSARMSEKP